MAKYRKKPVVVEAWPARDLFQAARFAWDILPIAVKDAYEAGDLIFADSPSRILIRTLEGWMTGDLDYWIIQGVKNELYPCKPDIFEATYEAAK